MIKILPSADKTATFAPLAIRIAVGASMALHGYQKFFEYGLDGVSANFEAGGMPLPYVSAILASSAEFFGGILLLLGAFSRYAAVPVAFTMFVAALWHWSDPFAKMEYPLVLMLGAVSVFLSGPGKLSVDELFLNNFLEEKFGGDKPSSGDSVQEI